MTLEHQDKYSKIQSKAARVNFFVDEILKTHPVLNRQSKKRIMSKNDHAYNVDKIAKAITHFAFRNGPVETMHAGPESQLSQNDMKTLNTYMVNRLAYVFELILSDRWAEFELLIESYKYYGAGWDPAIPDDDGMMDMLKNKLNDQQ
jgi:hypothetical protein